MRVVAWVVGACALWGAGCSTVPNYKDLDLADTAVLPSVEVRHAFAEEGDAGMFVAASTTGAKGSDSGSLGAGEFLSVGGEQLAGPTEWDADFELRLVEFVIGARLPLEPVDFDVAIGIGGVGGVLDLTGDTNTISEELDFVGLVAGLAFEFPLADWLVGRTALDGVVGDEATFTRLDATLRARLFRGCFVELGYGMLSYSRTDLGESDLELRLSGPRAGGGRGL
jgi:hypothetical protein